MYSLGEYIRQELLQNSKRKFLSFAKIILKKGRLNAVLWIRIFLVSSQKKNIIHSLITLVASNKLQRDYGIELSKSTKIGMGLKLGHPNGIIFGEGTIIGKNVTVYHQVTFGIKSAKYRGDLNAYPVVEDDSIIYGGAKILGNITIRKGTIIGANSVLLGSTEQNSVYVGIPARKIKDNKI